MALPEKVRNLSTIVPAPLGIEPNTIKIPPAFMCVCVCACVCVCD